MNEQAPQTDLRPKLRNIALPHEAVRCFVCGLHLLTKGGTPTDQFQVVAVPGIIFFACVEHVEAGQAFCQQTANVVEASLKAFSEKLSQQQTKTE